MTVATGAVLAPATIIDGRYRIDRQIGEGGMGSVYLAEHLLIGRKVALKVLHTEYVDDTGTVERFFAEAKTTGKLGHPHLVESTDMGFVDGKRPYIAFEFLEGQPLSEAIHHPSAAFPQGMTTQRALLIAEQVASGLNAAHAAGVVHRDLKAENVFLVQRDGLEYAKILDFGVSLFLEQPGRQSKRGIILGTPEYLSPEQIATPETVDHRADVYALGVILYEALARRRPFEGTPRTLLHRIQHEAAPPLTDVPHSVARLVERLMAKNPSDRFADARQAEDAIAAIADALADGHDPDEQPVRLATGRVAITSRRQRTSNRSQPYARAFTGPTMEPTVEPSRAGTPWPVVTTRMDSVAPPVARMAWWPAAIILTGIFVAGGLVAWRHNDTAAMAAQVPPVAPVPTVRLRISAATTDASVMFRGQPLPLPVDISIPSTDVVESITITAPGHAPHLQWIRTDQDLDLSVPLTPTL